eukprot:8602045-Pyramimonas_sp.AAC.1
MLDWLLGRRDDKPAGENKAPAAEEATSFTFNWGRFASLRHMCPSTKSTFFLDSRLSTLSE